MATIGMDATRLVHPQGDLGHGSQAGVVALGRPLPARDLGAVSSPLARVGVEQLLDAKVVELVTTIGQRTPTPDDQHHDQQQGRTPERLGLLGRAECPSETLDLFLDLGLAAGVDLGEEQAHERGHLGVGQGLDLDGLEALVVLGDLLAIGPAGCDRQDPRVRGQETVELLTKLPTEVAELVPAVDHEHGSRPARAVEGRAQRLGPTAADEALDPLLEPPIEVALFAGRAGLTPLAGELAQLDQDRQGVVALEQATKAPAHPGGLAAAGRAADQQVSMALHDPIGRDRLAAGVLVAFALAPRSEAQGHVHVVERRGRGSARAHVDRAELPAAMAATEAHAVLGQEGLIEGRRLERRFRKLGLAAGLEALGQTNVDDDAALGAGRIGDEAARADLAWRPRPRLPHATMDPKLARTRVELEQLKHDGFARRAACAPTGPSCRHRRPGSDP